MTGESDIPAVTVDEQDDLFTSLRRDPVEIRDADTQRYVRQLIRDYPVAALHQQAFRQVGCDFSYASRDDNGCWSAIVEPNRNVQRVLGMNLGVHAYYTPYMDLQTRTVDRVRQRTLGARRVDNHLFFLHSPDVLAKRKLEDWTINQPYSVVLLPREGEPVELAKEIIGDVISHFAARSPYERTSPVVGDEFYGRTELLKQMVNELRAGHVCGVFGLRKTGKTSLVTELGRQFVADSREDRIFILRDLEVLPDDPAEQVPQLIADLASQLQQRFREVNMRTHELSMVDDRSSIGQFRRAVQASLTHPTGKEKTVVVALDEIESLVGPDAATTTSRPQVPEFLGAMRSLVQENRNFNVVMSGITVAPFTKPTLYGRENPLFAWARPMFVTSLTNRDSANMILKLGSRMALRWQSDAIAAILNLTGGQVFLTRSFAGAVAAEMSTKLEGRTVTAADVARVSRSWRRSVAVLADSMLDALARFYPSELAVLQLGQEAGSFADLEELYPTEIDSLISLGLLVDHASVIMPAPWTQLSTMLRR